MVEPLVCMITSCKGGVGKSTVCANLGRALQLLGKRVVMVDCDFGMRTLDLICGVADYVVYDCFDVLWGGISPQAAAIEIPLGEDTPAEGENAPALFLIAAPFNIKSENFDRHGTFRLPEPSDMKALISILTENLEPDVILLDMPGSVTVGSGLENEMVCSPMISAAKVSDAAIICTTDQPASIRAASKTASELREAGLGETRLLINQFEPRDSGKRIRPSNSFAAKRKKRELIARISSLIDQTAIKLCGVIPYDLRFPRAAETGELIDSDAFRRGGFNPSGKRSDSAKAFENLARRLYGASGIPFSGIVSLFDGFKDLK